MSVDRLLFAMFPGDPARDFPSFETLQMDASTLAEPGFSHAISAAFAETSANGPEDVNEVLRALRKSHPDQAQAFIDAALAAYFTAPPVVRRLQGGRETLFPHARTLPDIDYALLEPVIERPAPKGSP